MYSQLEGMAPPGSTDPKKDIHAIKLTFHIQCKADAFMFSQLFEPANFTRVRDLTIAKHPDAAEHTYSPMAQGMFELYDKFGKQLPDTMTDPRAAAYMVELENEVMNRRIEQLLGDAMPGVKVLALDPDKDLGEQMANALGKRPQPKLDATTLDRLNDLARRVGYPEMKEKRGPLGKLLTWAEGLMASEGIPWKPGELETGKAMLRILKAGAEAKGKLDVEIDYD